MYDQPSVSKQRNNWFQYSYYNTYQKIITRSRRNVGRRRTLPNERTRMHARTSRRTNQKRNASHPVYTMGESIKNDTAAVFLQLANKHYDSTYIHTYIISCCSTESERPHRCCRLPNKFSSHQIIVYTAQLACRCPNKQCPFPLGHPDPTWIHGPTNSASQMTSRSLQSF